MMSPPSSRSRTPRWPLSAQIIALMFGCLIVAQVATLGLTLVLPPAPEPQYGLDDIAAAMRGALKTQKGARPLTRTVSARPPSLQSAGWLASEGSSAELARMLGASPADVRLLFYTPLPFAGAAPARAVEAQAPVAAPLVREPSPRPEPVVLDLDSGEAISGLIPVVYQAGPEPGEGGARVTVRALGAGSPPGEVMTGAVPMAGPGRGGMFVRSFPEGAGMEMRRLQRAVPLGRSPMTTGRDFGGATPEARGAFLARGRVADGRDPSQGPVRTPIWPDSRPMTLRGLANGRAMAAPADGEGPRIAAQVSEPSGVTAAVVSGWRSQTGPGAGAIQFRGLRADAGPQAAVPSPVVAGAAPAVRMSARRPMDWTVRLPGREVSGPPPAPVERVRTPAWRTESPASVESASAASVRLIPPPPMEIEPAPAPTTAAVVPSPVFGPPASPAAAPAPVMVVGEFEPDRLISRGLFGLAPAPMIEGDFVAAWREGPGRWIVVRPTPEAFPNSWQRRVLLWFALSLAVVAPLGYLFARSLTTPLTEFVKAAELIGRDPSAAVVVKEGPAEVGRAGRAFNQMHRRLKRFVDDRAAVVSALSHDLRAPLLRMRFRAEKASPEVRAGMLYEVAQMEDMITSVLAFMRDVSEAGPRQPVDLRSVLECVIDDAALTGGEAVLESAEDVLVEADAQGVRRALTNLVENALKYGESARARLYIEGGEAIVEIVDKGPGVPETELERVFQPFYRTQQAKNSDKSGVGLGLVSARSMVRAHGGEISLKNSGAGLIAQVRLPLPRQAA